MKRTLFFLVIYALTPWIVSAQNSDDRSLQQAGQLLIKLQQHILATPQSFDMRYTYANEHTPAILLDSLEGKMTVAGKYYRCLIRNTETIRNDHYHIIVFHDDRLIYLSVPPAIDTAAMQPLQMLEKMMKQQHIERCEIARKGPQQTIRFIFPKDQLCKRMEMTVDTASWQIKDFTSIVKTSTLVDEQVTLDKSYDEYAIVKTTFSHYAAVAPSAQLFDASNFFYKSGKEYKPAAAFPDYKIFIGSPQLQ
ncbi:hypothetical protein [Chitinophaga vietnamensis]|uniref:hypothetical protein n=1 Tax=Chitinophaga vietnamensis TaxID=2593957 RepID=UPI0011786720|nr:hypothetical protein [Chitinophaga vietnamensis]